MIKGCALRRECVCERTEPFSTCHWQRCSGKEIGNIGRTKRELTSQQDLESLVRDFHRCVDFLCSLPIEINEALPSKLVDNTSLSKAFKIARKENDSDQQVVRVDYTQININKSMKSNYIPQR